MARKAKTTCVNMKARPSPMTAQEVATIPVVAPWLSLAVPPAWIIHLRFFYISLFILFSWPCPQRGSYTCVFFLSDLTTSLHSDQHFFTAHWQCHWCLLYTIYYAINNDMLMIIMTIYPMVSRRREPHCFLLRLLEKRICWGIWSWGAFFFCPYHVIFQQAHIFFFMKGSLCTCFSYYFISYYFIYLCTW